MDTRAIKRGKYISDLVDKRMTFKEIGQLLDISKQRIQQIYSKYKKNYIPKPLKIIKERKIKLSKLSIIEKQIKLGPQIGKFDPYNISASKNGGGRGRMREAVRIRDNHTCQICLKKWEIGQRRFDVHHLDPNEEGKEAFKFKNNLDHTKMITLCHKCHIGLDHIRAKISKGSKGG